MSVVQGRIRVSFVTLIWDLVLDVEKYGVDLLFMTGTCSLRVCTVMCLSVGFVASLLSFQTFIFVICSQLHHTNSLGSGFGCCFVLCQRILLSLSLLTSSSCGDPHYVTVWFCVGVVSSLTITVMTIRSKNYRQFVVLSQKRICCKSERVLRVFVSIECESVVALHLSFVYLSFRHNPVITLMFDA